MASSDLFADEALTAIVHAGGSWYFRLLDTIPPDDLSTFSLIATIPAVTIPRTAVAWTVSARQANPVTPISLSTASVVATVVPVAWCLFSDAGCTLPRISGRLADLQVTPGSTVNVPTATVTIRYPASVAATL